MEKSFITSGPGKGTEHAGKFQFFQQNRLNLFNVKKNAKIRNRYNNVQS